MSKKHVSKRERYIMKALRDVEMNNGYIYYEDAYDMLDQFYTTVVEEVEEHMRKAMEKKFKGMGW